MTGYWVIIPAAGWGERFSSGTPKQYYSLLGKTILAHTIELFLFKPWVKKMFIPISDKDNVFKTLPYVKEKKIVTLSGGETRILSVLCALQAIKKEKDAKGSDKVIVHDAVRPCLHEEDLQSFIQSMQDSGEKEGALLAMRCQDTMKWVSQEKSVYTVDRSTLWHALTPQCFSLNKLEEVLIRCEEEGRAVTDESSAFEQCGYFPKIVEAKHLNPKLTYPRDKHIISLLLKRKQEEKK